MKKNIRAALLSIIFMSQISMYAHGDCSGHHGAADSAIYQRYIMPLITKGQNLALTGYDTSISFYNDNKELVQIGAVAAALVGMAYIVYRTCCSVESNCTDCKENTDHNN